MKRAWQVVGGNKGGDAFQFGTTVYVETNDDTVHSFEVSVCEVICEKDTAEILSNTIVKNLTKGLKNCTKTLHIYTDTNDNVKCQFGDAPASESVKKIKSHDKVPFTLLAILLSLQWSLAGNLCLITGACGASWQRVNSRRLVIKLAKCLT